MVSTGAGWLAGWLAGSRIRHAHTGRVWRCSCVCLVPLPRSLRVFLPDQVDVDSVSAKFSKKERKLSLCMTRLVTKMGIAKSSADRNFVPDDAFERELTCLHPISVAAWHGRG
eukprot:SAG25_NODE_137_length_14197_cov_30.387120_8_plen_113_part_00